MLAAMFEAKIDSPPRVIGASVAGPPPPPPARPRTRGGAPPSHAASTPGGSSPATVRESDGSDGGGGGGLVPSALGGALVGAALGLVLCQLGPALLRRWRQRAGTTKLGDTSPLAASGGMLDEDDDDASRVSAQHACRPLNAGRLRYVDELDCDDEDESGDGTD